MLPRNRNGRTRGLLHRLQVFRDRWPARLHACTWLACNTYAQVKMLRCCGAPRTHRNVLCIAIVEGGGTCVRAVSTWYLRMPVAFNGALFKTLSNDQLNIVFAIVYDTTTLHKQHEQRDVRDSIFVCHDVHVVRPTCHVADDQTGFGPLVPRPVRHRRRRSIVTGDHVTAVRKPRCHSAADGSVAQTRCTQHVRTSIRFDYIATLTGDRPRRSSSPYLSRKCVHFNPFLAVGSLGNT